MNTAIANACQKLGNGRENVRIRLAELRAELNSPRAELDAALRAMERDGSLSLYPLDNPQEITAADREAAIVTFTGHKRHILYFGGRAS